MPKQPVKSRPVYTFTSFDATLIKATLTPLWLNIDLGGHAFFFYFDSRPEVAAQENAFFQKVLVDGISAHLSYRPDELWWMTFWTLGQFRVGWWRVMADGTHEFKYEGEEHV